MHIFSRTYLEILGYFVIEKQFYFKIIIMHENLDNILSNYTFKPFWVKVLEIKIYCLEVKSAPTSDTIEKVDYRPRLLVSLKIPNH